MPQRGYRMKQWAVANDPKINVMRALHEAGKLTPEQSLLYVPQKPDEELYDLKDDPNEYHNLAQSPEHREVLGRMRELLDHWIEQTNDAGQYREKREEAMETQWFNYDATYGHTPQQD
jgi:hypothetical protein